MAETTGCKNALSVLSADQLMKATIEIRGQFLAARDEYYSEWSISTALRKWAASRHFQPSAVDRSLTEKREFLRILETIVSRDRRPVYMACEANVFNGMRAFSFDRFRALTRHFTRPKSGLFKTKLNKLLFYSDFVHYYLHGRSISGSRYIHFPFGPVPDAYEGILGSLSTSGAVNMISCPGFELVTQGQNSGGPELTESELETASWVIEKFGGMSSSEISEYSHREKAYRFTRMGDQIAYEYAKYLYLLPN